MLILLLLSAALAAPKALVVHLCGEATGCVDERLALQVHAAQAGLAWMDLASLLDASRGAQRAAFADALDAFADRPSASTEAEAWRALGALQAPALPDDLFRLWMLTAKAAWLRGDPTAALVGFSRAAGVSGGRSNDLPELPEDALQAYLSEAEHILSSPRATLMVQGRRPAVLWVDGHREGDLPPGALSVELSPGWHRLVLERPGVPGATVLTVEAAGGRVTPLRIDSPPAEGATVRETALLGVMNGAEPDPEHAAEWAAVARAAGFDALRFVKLVRAAEGIALPGEERCAPRWPQRALRSLWLEAAPPLHGAAAPWALRMARQGEQLRLGVGLGYSRLGDTDHLGVEGLIGLPLGGWAPLGVELRLGILRANQDYFLYRDWVDPHLFPVSLGLRVAPPQGGPRARLSAVAIIPYALGAEAALGWEQGLTERLRLVAEGSVGLTDQGLLAGGRLWVVTRR